MGYLTLMLYAAAAVTPQAQSQPQLTFQGYITGSAVLYIQADRVDIQGRDTGSVDRPQYRFSAPLPPLEQKVRFVVERGRGSVAVVEQPAAENEYTAVVRLDPPEGGPELYSVNFFWNVKAGETRNRTPRRPAPTAGEMAWSGTVDEEALIVVSGQEATIRTVRGKPVEEDQVSFVSPMPRDAVVALTEAEGRGSVELLEQPSEENRYTAVVRIVDEPAGAGKYAFQLRWDDARPEGDEETGEGGALRGGDDDSRVSGYGSVVRWSGRVDGTIRVNLQGTKAWVDRESGAPVYNDHVNFGAPLPRRDLRDVEIRKLEGRGDVTIVERPEARNGYTLVFEIDDDASGAGDYVVEVSWR